LPLSHWTPSQQTHLITPLPQLPDAQSLQGGDLADDVEQKQKAKQTSKKQERKRAGQR
jgi:hypothetical protein